jgi:hypothetical protein
MAMEEERTTHEKTIRRKHRFSFSAPAYEESFQTELNQKVCLAIVSAIFDKLSWTTVYLDKASAEAKRKSWGSYMEKITVSYEYGTVKVQSASLNGGFWDGGRNSLNVQRFIRLFLAREKGYDTEAIVNLEKEIDKINEEEYFEIPENLPPPLKRNPLGIRIPLVGGFVLSLLLGYAITILSLETIYVPIFYEFSMAFIISYTFKYLLGWSNYVDFGMWKRMIWGVAILTCFSNKLFLYMIMLSKGIPPEEFLNFLKAIERQPDVHFDSMGWELWMVGWLLQVAMIGWMSNHMFILKALRYLLLRVPPEVFQFAAHHFDKGKTEDEVRVELGKKGWSDPDSQEDVINALLAHNQLIYLNRQ